MLKRIMAVDYGDARTGVAFSDPFGMIVGKCLVISEYNEDKLLQKIIALVKEENVGKVVFGLPRNMDGTEGVRADKYRDFSEKLKKNIDAELILWDERRTTIEAHQILHANEKKMKDHKKNVDAVAASLMLEGYLRYSSINENGM